MPAIDADLRLSIVPHPQSGGCEWILANHGPATLWNVEFSTHELSLDLFRLDDTHMPPEARWPPVVFPRIDPGQAVRHLETWPVASFRCGPSGRGRYAVCSLDEGARVRRVLHVPFVVHATADRPAPGYRPGTAVGAFLRRVFRGR